MSRFLKSVLPVLATIAVLAVPATASARSTSVSAMDGAVRTGHAARPLTFYQEAVRDQQEAETRFYAIPASTPGDGLGALTYVLAACAALLAGAGAVAAWRVERRAPQPLVLTAS